MRVLIVGAKGTIGRAVLGELGERHEIVTAGRSSGDLRVDITRPESIRAMFEQAGEMLESGLSVVLDGTFLTAEWQNGAARLARESGAQLLFVTCRCPAETARQRIDQRRARHQGFSEATPDLHDLQQQEDSPLSSEYPAVELDTTESISSQTRTVFDALRPK